jgi:hypothetical protein
VSNVPSDTRTPDLSGLPETHDEYAPQTYTRSLRTGHAGAKDAAKNDEVAGDPPLQSHETARPVSIDISD